MKFSVKRSLMFTPDSSLYGQPRPKRGQSLQFIVPRRFSIITDVLPVLPEFSVAGGLKEPNGFFRFGETAICYGRSTGATSQESNGHLFDASKHVERVNDTVVLPVRSGPGAGQFALRTLRGPFRLAGVASDVMDSRRLLSAASDAPGCSPEVFTIDLSARLGQHPVSQLACGSQC